MSERRWAGDGLDPEDMAIPEIKLIQNVGGSGAKEAGAKPGDFYSSLTGDVIPGGEGFELIIIAMQKNRTYWGRDDILDDPPSCASMNASSMKSINGDDCENCPHRNEMPWMLSPAERRTKCLVNYNVLGIELNNDLPVLIRTTGISAKATKELYTQLSLNKLLADGWYKAKTRVTAIPKKSAAGDAFAINFGKLELLPDDVQLQEYRIRSQQLLGTQIALPERASEEVPPSEEKPEQPAKEAAPEKTSEPEPKPEDQPPINLDF